MGYVREAENLEHAVDDPFPPLPEALLISSAETSEGPATWGYSVKALQDHWPEGGSGWTVFAEQTRGPRNRHQHSASLTSRTNLGRDRPRLSA